MPMDSGASQNENHAEIARQIAAMPASGADTGKIARLIGENPDPDLFWSICDWGTMSPHPPALQAMLEMLFRKDIRLNPKAGGETLDQLAYHAPVFIVEAYLARIEHLLADDPDHAADCWTDLTQTLAKRMSEAGRDDLAPRIAAIDRSVEEVLRDQDRRAMLAVFDRFDPVAKGRWQGEDVNTAVAAFEDCFPWDDLLPDFLTVIEPRLAQVSRMALLMRMITRRVGFFAQRRAQAFWAVVLMRAIARHARFFATVPDETLGQYVLDALDHVDGRPADTAATAGLAVIATRDAPALCAAFATAARRAGDRLGVDFEARGVPNDAPPAATALRRLVARAAHYVQPPDERLHVPAALRSLRPFGETGAGPSASRDAYAGIDTVMQALCSGFPLPDFPAAIRTAWSDQFWRQAALDALATALADDRVRQPDAAGLLILRGLQEADDVTLTAAAKAAAAFLRSQQDEAWKDRLWWAGSEVYDRRVERPRDLHRPLMDLLWDAR